MERIRVPAGTAQKFESVFKKLQDAIQKNQFNRIDIFVKSYGSIVNVNNNTPQDTNWQVQVVDGDSRQIHVMIGGTDTAKGLSLGDHYLKISAQATMIIAAGLGSNDGDSSYTVIYAEHRDAYSDNLPVVDGFVYDESGNVAQAATSIKDTTVLIQNSYTTLSLAWSAAQTPFNSRVTLAIVKTIRVAGSWQIDLTTWTDALGRSITNGVSDLRYLHRVLLNENLIDDKKILFKDRDSSRAYERGVQGNVTFEKRVHFDQDISMALGSRLALGGIDGLVDETTTTTGMSIYPAMSLYGTNRLNTSFHIQTTSTSSADGPQLRFISPTNSMGITTDPSTGALTLGPLSAGLGTDALDITKGVMVESDGNVKLPRKVNLGSHSLEAGEPEYETSIHSNLRAAKTGIFGKQVVIGASYTDYSINTEDAGTYETLTVANPDATRSNKASILISQAAKGLGKYAELDFLVTDTSDGTYKRFIRLEATAVNEESLTIGKISSGTNSIISHASFDSSGNLRLYQNLTTDGTLTVTDNATFNNVATFTENLVAVDQVGIGIASGTDLSSAKPVLSISNTHNPSQTTLVNIANSSTDSDTILAMGGPSSGGSTYRFGLHTQINAGTYNTAFSFGRIHPTNNSLQDSFISWDWHGNATHYGDFLIHDTDNASLLTTDIFRNIYGASFDKQVIVGAKIGVGYAYGTNTSSWAEQLKLTNPEGVDHVVLKLENTTDELDSLVILHTKNDSGPKRWGIKADGGDSGLVFGKIGGSNNLNSTYLTFDQDPEKIILEKDTELFTNVNLSTTGGNITVNTTSSNSILTAHPSKKKVVIGYGGDELSAFTNPGGGQGDYDLVVGVKDAPGASNANLALVTEISSVTREFEFELQNAENQLNMRSWTDGLEIHMQGAHGLTTTQFTLDSGKITTSSLELTGNIAEGNYIAALTIPQSEPILFDGIGQQSHIQNASASGGYFSIYNNVTPYSFGGPDGSIGTTQDNAYGWAGITLKTYDTTVGGEIDFFTGGNPGNNAITDRDADMVLQLTSSSSGTKTATVIGSLQVKKFGDEAGPAVINAGDSLSTIKNLGGDVLNYVNANLTQTLEAYLVKSTELQAGGVFASSGQGLIHMKGRVDIDSSSSDNAVISMHPQHGNGIVLEASDSFQIRSAEFTGDDFVYTGANTLLDINYASSRVTVGGMLVAPSGIFDGDIEVTGQVETNYLTAHTAVIPGLNSTSATISSLTASTLDLENSTVKINPGTKFDCSISGVSRDGYLVTASGSSYFIGQGELGVAAQNFPGVEMLVAPPTPTEVTNFRITDINPHSDMLLAKDRVKLEWGYKSVTGVNGSTVSIQGTSYPTFITNIATGDIIDLPDTNGADKVSGRYLRMASGRKHKVVAWDNSTKIFTLAVTYDDAESATAVTPAKLVDSGAGYTLSVLKVLDNETIIPWQAFTLGPDFIDAPVYEVELELAYNYYFSMVTTDGTKSSDALIMVSGVFDPDSNAGGQGLTAYSAPFVNKLPYLTNLPSLSDHLTLDATQYGFTVTVNGWGSTDFGQTLNTDPHQIAHQFELGYTTADTFDWSSPFTVRTTMPFVSANNFPVANIYDSDTYTVAVRPLQNNQVVLDESTHGVIKKTILAGGGGVPPNMQVLVDSPFNIATYSGTYTAQYNGIPGNAPGMDVTTLSGVSFLPDPLLSVVTLAYNQLTPNVGGSANMLDVTNDPSLSNRVITYNQQYTGLDVGNEGGPGGSTITVHIAGSVAVDFSGVSTAFTIGKTEAARKLIETQLEADYHLKKIVVDIDFASGASGSNPGIIRVYPKGNPAAGDVIQITADQGLFTQAIDLTMNTSVEPNRTLMIDVFDSSASPNNSWSGTGRIWIYGSPYDSNMNKNQNTGLDL